jgi:signal peptide peptidase SppA
MDGRGRAVAYIPIYGVLTQRSSWDWFSQSTGYDAIRFAFLTAITDPDVAGVLLDIDSPGGEVCGCFDLVDLIYAARGTKPIVASLNESAYSAGYAIASAADKIFMPRTGGIGSVGCIMLHLDMSNFLENMGVTPTIIQYGERKSDGTDVAPLNKTARDRFQADIDAMGELFVNTVARNRNMKASAVRATQAATFMGAQGVKIGFADGIKSPLGAIRALQKAVA